MIGFMLLLSSLKADVLTRKTGEVLEGRFQSAQDGIITFEHQGVLLRIPATEIAGLDLGYPGASVCYTLRYRPEETHCDGLLVILQKGEVGFADPSGMKIKERLPASSLGSITFQKNSSWETIVPALQPGVRVKLVIRGSVPVEAEVTAVRGDRLDLRDTSGKTWQIKEEAIERGEILSAGPAQRNWAMLVPGLPQYRRGSRVRGLVWMGGYLGAAALAGFSFQQRERAIDAAHQDLRFWLVNSSSHVSDYRRYDGQLRATVAVLFLAYPFHLWDGGAFEVTSSQAGASTFVGITIRQ